jgi:hypothetical protein
MHWIRRRREAIRGLSSGRVQKNLRDEYGKEVAWPAPLSLRVFGEAGVRAIVLDDAVEADEVERVKRLFPEASVTQRFDRHRSVDVPSLDPTPAPPDDSPPPEIRTI